MKKSKVNPEPISTRQMAEEELMKRPGKVHLPLTEVESLRLMHELEVHQIELEMQNKELMEAKSKALLTAEQYTELYDFSPTSYFTLSRDEMILEMNLRGASMLGIERKRLANRPFGLFVSAQSKKAYHHFINKVFASRNPATCEIVAVPHTGEPVNLLLTGICVSNGRQCLLTAVDITEQRQAQKEALQTTDALVFLAQYTDRDITVDFFSLLAEYLAKALDAIFVCIDRLEGDGLNATTLAVWHKGVFEDNITYALKDTPCGDVVGKTICCFPASVTRFFPKDTVLQDLKAESYIGTTLWSHTGIPIGLIAVIKNTPLGNQRQAEELLKLVAVRASGELERMDIEAERKRAEQELFNLKESLVERIAERTSQLEAMNKELTFHINEIEQFTYITSHDLQEPLRNLTNFTKLIQEEYSGKLDDDGNKYIEFISGSAGRMRELVTGLLEYSILGKESVRSMVNCNKIVGEVLCDLANSITETNSAITVEKLPTINGFATELRLLFQNLINNAIKFRRQEIDLKIIISAKMEEKEWVFRVADNGIGISEHDLQKVFIIFKRMNKYTDYPGTGIGLAHCKKIVEMHGGKIWVESIPGSGSTFLFTIPKQ